MSTIDSPAFVIQRWQELAVEQVRNAAESARRFGIEETVDNVVSGVFDAIAAADQDTLGLPDGWASSDVAAYVRAVLGGTFGADEAEDEGLGSGGERTVLYTDTYTLILDFVSRKEDGGSQLAERDEEGNFVEAAPGVDGFTWLFLEGARTTNKAAVLGTDDLLGELAAGYNNLQYALRYGADPTATPTTFDDSGRTLTEHASDRIAYHIASAVSENQNGALPTLYEFGQSDGQLGAHELWFPGSEGERDPTGGGELGNGQEIGGWAGNPFFTILGTNQFFERDILYYKEIEGSDPDDPEFVIATEGTEAYENAAGYDLLALIEAFVRTGLAATGGSVGKIGQALAEAYDRLDGSPDDFGTLAGSLFFNAEQASKAEAFFDQAYGTLLTITDLLVIDLINGPLPTFPQMLDFGDSMAELSAKAADAPLQGVIALGTNNTADDAGDVMGTWFSEPNHRMSDFDDIAHAGRGDDTIYGGNGSDIIDGGRGEDEVSYEYEYRGRHVTVYQLNDHEAAESVIAESYVAQVSLAGIQGNLPFQWVDQLYGI